MKHDVGRDRGQGPTPEGRSGDSPRPKRGEESLPKKGSGVRSLTGRTEPQVGPIVGKDNSREIAAAGYESGSE